MPAKRLTDDLDYPTCASHQRGNSPIFFCGFELCRSILPVQWQLQIATYPPARLVWWLLLSKPAMQILIVATDRAAFWVAASLTARAPLIAILAKFAFPVKRAEFVYNVPRLLLAAVAAARPATTLRAASAARYAVALSTTQ